MTVSGIMGWLNIRGLALTVRLSDEIYDGQETYAAVNLENGKRLLPSFLLRVDIDEESVLFPLVGRRAAETGTISLTFRGRGRRAIDRAIVTSPFPINFFVRRTALRIDGHGIVFPRPRPCDGASGWDGRPSRGFRSAGGRGFEGDVEKIADYTGTEPLKLIHWRLSARHENLKVKELAATATDPLMLDLTRLPGQNPEEGLSCLAWLVNRSIRTSRPVGLVTKERTIAPDTSRSHRLRLLTEIALHGSR